MMLTWKTMVLLMWTTMLMGKTRLMRKTMRMGKTRWMRQTILMRKMRLLWKTMLLRKAKEKKHFQNIVQVTTIANNLIQVVTGKLASVMHGFSVFSFLPECQIPKIGYLI